MVSKLVWASLRDGCGRLLPLAWLVLCGHEISRFWWKWNLELQKN